MSQDEKNMDELQPMTQKLYRFAEAYYYATGRDRTYKAAAIAAGDKPTSAHTTGHRMAKLPQVQAYWRELDEINGAQRRAIHMKALMRLEELAEDEEIGKLERVGINDKIIERTASAFEVGETNAKLNQDESTQQTILQILTSIQAIAGDDDDTN